MIYSVFDWARGVYRYYETSEPDEISPSPRKASVRRVSEIGAVPEDIAARVPIGAKPIGFGPEAHGIVAVSGYEASATSPWVIVGLIVAAIGLYKFAR